MYFAIVRLIYIHTMVIFIIYNFLIRMLPEYSQARMTVYIKFPAENEEGAIVQMPLFFFCSRNVICVVNPSLLTSSYYDS